MSAANRNRGKRAEVAVVNYLRGRGYPDARRYLAGDGKQPGDIDAIPGLVIEVKDCAEARWKTWCAQAAAEADRINGVWVVVRRVRGVPDVGGWQSVAATKWGTSLAAPRDWLQPFGEWLDWWQAEEEA